MIAVVEAGSVLPLSFQIGDYNPAKYVRCYLYDDNNVELPQSPVDLSPQGALGMYQNNTVEMPDDSAHVIAQYVVYDDSGYITVSTSQGGGADTFIRNGLEIGGVLPLAFQMSNYDADLGVKAFVRDSNDDQIDGSPFELEPVGLLGLYVALGVVPDSVFAVAQFIVYTDDSYGTVSPAQGAGTDTFFFIATATFDISTLPNLGDALLDWFQPMTFQKMVKSVDASYRAKEVATNIRTRGVWMPLTDQQLRMKPEGQRSWKWYQLFAEPTLILNIDDRVKYLTVPYRVMARGPWERYGYIEYQLVEGFT